MRKTTEPTMVTLVSLGIDADRWIAARTDDRKNGGTVSLPGYGYTVYQRRMKRQVFLV
jgi:hypothetical protein